MKRRLTKEDREALGRQLQWRDDFEVEPLGGPVGPGSQERWTIRVSLGKRSVVLRQPSKGHILLDTGRRGPGARPSTGTSDPNEAIRFAEEWLTQEQLESLLEAEVDAAAVRAEDTITVGDVCDLLPRTDLVNAATYPRYQRAVRVARASMGPNLPIRKVVSKRRMEVAIRKRMAGVAGLPPTDHVTAVFTLKDFVTVCHRVGEIEDSAGEALSVRHPSLNLKVRWPAWSKRRREPATIEMFTILMSPVETVDERVVGVTLPAPVDRADPTGQLRLALAIWFYTGRRFESVLRLRVEDYITDSVRMRNVLMQAGEENGICKSIWAPHFPVLLNFRAEWDKENNWFPTPIHEALAQEFEHYFARTGLTSGWLFPSSDPRTRGKPIGQSCLSKRPHRRKRKDGSAGRLNMGRYDKAVLIACDDLRRSGRDPREIFPVTLRENFDPARDGELLRYDIRKGYKIHRLRSCFATTMEQLGYGKARGDDGNEGTNMDAHVNYIASWVTHDGTVKSQRYVHLDPRALHAVANFVPRRIAFREREDLTAELVSRAVAASARAIEMPGADGASEHVA
jgi:hypothetical protein